MADKNKAELYIYKKDVAKTYCMSLLDNRTLKWLV